MTYLLNGNMRTCKINNLYLLIYWLNNRFKELNFEKHKIDKSMLSSNSWLSGFIDADGHFRVNNMKNWISCGLESVQSSVDKQGFSKIGIIELLAQYLKVKMGKFGRKEYPKYLEYRVRTSGLNNNFILIDYIEQYPLFSS